MVIYWILCHGLRFVNVQEWEKDWWFITESYTLCTLKKHNQWIQITWKKHNPRHSQRNIYYLHRKGTVTFQSSIKKKTLPRKNQIWWQNNTTLIVTRQIYQNILLFGRHSKWHFLLPHFLSGLDLRGYKLQYVHQLIVQLNKSYKISHWEQKPD